MKKLISGWSLIKLYTILVYVWMFAPIVAVVILAFNPQQFGTFPMEGFSFKWFVKLSQNSTILDAFKNSLVLGSLTAVFATAIGVPAAMAFIRYEFKGKEFINTLLIVQARLVGIRREYEEAALSLGASPFQTFREITFPLLAPAIFAGMLFAFTISFDDVTATLFWATAQNQTVPVQIFSMLRTSISPEINALGAVMIVLTVSIPLAAGYVARRFARGNTP